MSKYGAVAEIAAQLLAVGRFEEPREAWIAAAKLVFPSSPSSVAKSCTTMRAPPRLRPMNGRSDDHLRHPHAACARFLEGLLPDPEALAQALTAEGWRRSAMHGKSGPASWQRTEEQEVVELLGLTLWDVFSNNQSVVDGDGVVYDLGSFRGSAGFIAESINRRYTQIPRAYDYIDFYMGTAMFPDRTGLRPVYCWIFGRLKAAGCRWIYSFPRLYLVDLSGPANEDGDPHDYDPSEAVRRETESDRRAEEVDDLSERLDQWHEEELRRARHRPLPIIVAAYRDIFGTLPEGWPHPGTGPRG